jgi:two-component system cell cycle response regulator DivK
LKKESQNLTILIVEDNVANFVLMARMLNYIGLHCEWKTSGYEVVEYADMLPRVDLILMDIRLPYDDGYAALKKLRHHQKFRETPIVAVTAYASDDQLERAREAGFNGFIGKPLDPDRFPAQVQRMLQGEAVWEIE